MNDKTHELISAALRKRAENGGRHLHHRDCIHNLTPEQQVEARGKTVEWWTKVIGPLPTQITPEQWETDLLDLNLSAPDPQSDYPPPLRRPTGDE